MSVYRVGGNKSSQNVFPSVRPTLDLDFANSKTLDPRITFTRSSGGSYVGADGLIKYAGVNEARFDHDPVTGESLGLLIEESRTNLVTWSQDFSQADWGKSGTTIVSTSVKSPIQGINYQKIEATGGDPFAGVTSNVITAATQQRSVSFFAQPLGNISRVLVIIQGVDARININLVDGTFTTNAAGAGSTVSVSGQRFSVSTPTLTGATGVRFFLKRTGDTNATSTFTTIFTGEGLYLTGPQVEVGAFPTSYIPTQASTRTRAADNARIIGKNFSEWYRQDEGSVVIKARTNVTTDGISNRFPYSMQIDSGVGSTNFAIDNGVLTNGAIRQVFAAQVGGVNISSGMGNNLSYNGLPCSFAYKTDDLAFINGGGTLFTKGNAPLSKNMVRLLIGTGNGGPIRGTVQSLKYFPKRLPNEQLRALTR
jgi:hypothetical protein